MHIVVVGAGLLGITTSYYLRKQGFDVTCIDRAKGPAMETSFANASILTPSLSDPWNAPGILPKMIKWIGNEESPMLLRAKALPSLLTWGIRFIRNSSHHRFRKNLASNVIITNYSLRIMEQLREELGLQYDQSFKGTLKVFRDEKALTSAINAFGLLHDEGVEYRVLNLDEVLETEPSLVPISEKLVGGILCPTDECGDAHKFCQGLARVAEDNGVRFRYNTTVSGFEKNNGRIKSILCSDGSLHGDKFIIAAGSYSPILASAIGIDIPVKPAKGYTITMPRGDWPDGPVVPVLDDLLHACVVPLGDRIRAGGTAEFAGYDRTIDEKRILNLTKLLREIYPEYYQRLDLNTIVPWTGLRPMSADGVPIIGKTQYKNLFLNTGHGHLGWSMAAGSGKMLADIISGVKPDVPASDYELARF